MQKAYEFDFVYDTQAAFRLLLEALSNPGRIVELGPLARKLGGAYAMPLTVAAVLLDNEVSFAVCGSPALAEKITELTLAKTAAVSKADYIFVTENADWQEAVQAAKCGTLRDPHKSATVILCTADLQAGKLQRISGQNRLSAATPELAREGMRRSTKLLCRSPLPGVVVAERRVPTPDGPLAARVYRPREVTEPGELMVFFHGGGWVIGDLDTHDDLCRFLALHTGIRVLSVDYRLAPEHPFPAAFDDCLAAYRYAVDNARELGTEPGLVSVGGDSAGGNLAASVALHATRSGLPRPNLQL